VSDFQSPDAAAEQPSVPATKKADKSTLAKGCAIGCGVLIVLAIFLGIGGFFVGGSMMDKLGGTMTTRLAEDFAVLKDTGQVPDGDAALYQEIVDLAQRPGTTFFGALLATTIVTTNLEDGEIDDAERQEANDTRDLLQENPEAGMFAVNSFMENHPGLKERMNQMQQTIGNMLAPR
jgi:hypothetical protein